MASSQSYMALSQIKLSLINFFIFIGLLRLTNFNYYLSKLLGFETTVNHTGGDAFNFINYIAVFSLVAVLFVKREYIRTKWSSLLPYGVLIIVYTVNIIVAPFGNVTWYFYQLLFIVVAMVLHIYVRSSSGTFSPRLRRGIEAFYWVLIAFVVFCLVQILLQHSVGYYLIEFNDAFVHSLDDFGIMKQRFGYLLGFLLSYTLFIKKRRSTQILVLILLICTGFGIRSFIIGTFGALAVFTIRNPRYFIAFGMMSVTSIYLLSAHYFDNLLFDTRFYSFYNAYDIVLKFPFGVGLGGYPVYTETFSRNLFAQFYNVNAILDFIPTAPESDIVHLFGSLGLVGAVTHLTIQGRMVWHSFALQRMFNPFEKCILFYFCFMTFFGLSEDSMFSINYWIFFGISTGVISAALRRRKAQKV